MQIRPAGVRTKNSVSNQNQGTQSSEELSHSPMWEPDSLPTEGNLLTEILYFLSLLISQHPLISPVHILPTVALESQVSTKWGKTWHISHPWSSISKPNVVHINKTQKLSLKLPASSATLYPSYPWCLPCNSGKVVLASEALAYFDSKRMQPRLHFRYALEIFLNYTY